MELCDLLSITRGVAALIGSGGKTTMLSVLSDELSRRGTVVVCTSTHILPPPLPLFVTPTADELIRALAAERCVCVGTPCPDGKLTTPSLPFSALAAAADYVLVEADGANGLPVKAHLPHEPVVPEMAARTVLVVGASGFGRSIADAVHRPKVYCRLTGAKEDDPVTPENLAAALAAERLSDTIFINQCDAARALRLARETAALVPCRVYAGALEKREWTCIS